MLGFSAVSEAPVSYAGQLAGESSPPDEVPVEVFRGISYQLVSRAGVVRPNLTNLSWSLFSQLNPAMFSAPVATGTLTSTDGAALLQIPLTVGQAASGQYCLAMSNADNTSMMLALVTVA